MEPSLDRTDGVVGVGVGVASLKSVSSVSWSPKMEGNSRERPGFCMQLTAICHLIGRLDRWWSVSRFHPQRRMHVDCRWATPRMPLRPELPSNLAYDFIRYLRFERM